LGSIHHILELLQLLFQYHVLSEDFAFWLFDAFDSLSINFIHIKFGRTQKFVNDIVTDFSYAQRFAWNSEFCFILNISVLKILHWVNIGSLNFSSIIVPFYRVFLSQVIHEWLLFINKFMKKCWMKLSHWILSLFIINNHYLIFFLLFLALIILCYFLHRDIFCTCQYFLVESFFIWLILSLHCMSWIIF
jgi:hypothetical protein